jgi:hypothetical protein
MRHSAARLAKRIATGVPEPSPQLKVDPAAVVTRRSPVRNSVWQTTRSNRSTGRLHRVTWFFARGAHDLPAGAAVKPRPWSIANLRNPRIKTKSLGRRNALASQQPKK